MTNVTELEKSILKKWALSSKTEKDGEVTYELTLKIKVEDPREAAHWASVREGAVGTLHFDSIQMSMEDKLSSK